MTVHDTGEIRSKLRTHLATRARRFPDVDVDRDSLVDTGVLDSVAIEELLVFIERSLGAKIEDDEVLPEDFDTLDTITRLVARKQRR